jgi:hypothetical protein
MWMKSDVPHAGVKQTVKSRLQTVDINFLYAEIEIFVPVSGCFLPYFLKLPPKFLTEIK